MSLGLRHQSRLIPLLRVTAKTFAQLFRPKLAEFPVKMDFCTFMICMGFYHSMQVLVFCLNAENSSSSTQLSLLHFSGTSIGTNNSLPVVSLPDQQAIPFFSNQLALVFITGWLIWHSLLLTGGQRWHAVLVRVIKVSAETNWQRYDFKPQINLNYSSVIHARSLVNLRNAR